VSPGIRRSIAAPVFVGDQLFCWVANVLHHSDVGGSMAGSFCIDAADIFTDPAAFPPFKIVEAGRIRPDMEQVFLRQSRLPRVVQMDLRAAISANTVTVRKIETLIARYGADAVKTVMSEVVDAGEELFVERLRQIPDGTWSHRLYAEASHTGDTGLYRYELTVRKRGDELVVDNAGTDPQAGSINVTYAGLVGAFLSALTASLTPDLAGAYGGVYRRVRFEPVPGTLSCAYFPAAVSPAGVFTMELLISLSGSVVAKMVAAGPPELRDRALGPAQPHWYGTIIAGQQPSGAPYIAVNANNMIGALPAGSDTDGADFGGHFWIPGGIASNIEETEQLYPMLCLYRRALRCGADGAGAYRGGRSMTEAYVPWGVPGMVAALYIDDSFPKAVGPFGANPGSMGRSASSTGWGWPSSSPRASYRRSWTACQARNSRSTTRDRCSCSAPTRSSPGPARTAPATGIRWSALRTPSRATWAKAGWIVPTPPGCTPSPGTPRAAWTRPERNGCENSGSGRGWPPPRRRPRPCRPGWPQTARICVPSAETSVCS
jgi:N-methylhydantoinase B